MKTSTRARQIPSEPSWATCQLEEEDGVEEDEEEHEEDRLGVASIRQTRSRNATTVYATILNGKPVDVTAPTTRRKTAPIQTLQK